MSSVNDEIDLGAVLKGIRGMFSGIMNWFNSLFQTFKKRFGIILALIALGAAGGFAHFYFSRPTYISHLTLSSSILSNDFCADIIGDLDRITEDKSYSLLAEKLSIDLKDALQIKEISFENYNEKLKLKYDNMDTVVLGLPFKIKVIAFNNSVFERIEKPIIDYLEKNEYSLKRKEINKQNAIELQNKLKNEMLQLDSLKSKVSEHLLPRGVSSGFVFGQPVDPINIYREGINLFQDELALKRALLLIDNIQIIKSFTPREKPDSPKLMKSILILSGAGFVLGLFIAMRLERKSERT